MATLAQFRTRVSAKLGLDNTTGGDQGLIDDWVNEGYEQVLIRTGAKVQSDTLTLSASTASYTLSSSVLSVIDVYTLSGSTNYQLQRVTPEQIIRMRTLNTTSSSPTRYYAVSGADLFIVHPQPSAADTVEMIIVKRPAALSASSDTPSDLPSEWHKAIEYYALWQGGDYDDDQSSSQGERYRQTYEQYLSEVKQANQRKGGARLAPAQVNYRRRLLWPDVPSRDRG